MFSALGLSSSACASLARLGYHTPTPVQTQAIPLVLSGVDLLARAQTGTGKTAAFGLPLIDRLSSSASHSAGRAPRALVLVPTRELATQVYQSLSDYAASTRLSIAVIFGGVNMKPQRQLLQRGVDIIVATPGRLIDHLDRKSVNLSAIEVLTLDEADRMLDMGFLPSLRRIVSALPKTRQTLLFSATFSEAITRLASEYTRDAKRVDVTPREVVASTVTHQVHEVPLDRKRDALAHILHEGGTDQALVFCRTKRGANRVAEDLNKRDLRASVIHGNKSQNARDRALDDFKAGRVRILVATDIAARGLDIVQLPLVVNFDLPLVPEDYVHRIGRTGRAGQRGRAVSLMSAADATVLRDIQRVVSAPLERVALPLAAMATRQSDAKPSTPHAPAHRTREGSPNRPRRRPGQSFGARRGRKRFGGSAVQRFS